MHETAKRNLIEVTELLLQNGASQSVEDDDGKTARDLADDEQSNEVLDILEYHIGYDERAKMKAAKERKQEAAVNGTANGKDNEDDHGDDNELQEATDSESNNQAASLLSASSTLTSSPAVK